MWQVKVSEAAATVFESKLLTAEDRIIIQKWAQTIVVSGPEALLLRPDIWDDHPLFGDWWGYRSSRFSYIGRIIYKVNYDKRRVVVFKITPDHNYSKD